MSEAKTIREQITDTRIISNSLRGEWKEGLINIILKLDPGSKITKNFDPIIGRVNVTGEYKGNPFIVDIFPKSLSMTIEITYQGKDEKASFDHMTPEYFNFQHELNLLMLNIQMR